MPHASKEQFVKSTPFFTAGGHNWPLRITPPVARKIRDELGVDLFAVTDPPATNPFVRLSGDMYLLSDVLWQLCSKLAAERNIDREQFESDLWDAIDGASDTLLEAVIQSFPEKKRAGLVKLLAAQNDALDRVVAKLAPKMDQVIDAALDEIVAAATQSTRTDSQAA